jgi:hypothetical protein
MKKGEGRSDLMSLNKHFMEHGQPELTLTQRCSWLKLP